MNRRVRSLIALGAGLLIVGGGAIGASASTGGFERSPSNSLVSFLKDNVEEVGELVGIETSVAPGTIDDGQELLPQARISLDEAITGARAAYDGPLGEVDLESYEGHLVFNIDVGDRDVKVDARTGLVLGSERDD